ncbi:MAG TPA: serine/threonine-protein kinase [bacterium]|nr:serine/threonine-protein kinase [bacterium]
MSLALFNPTTIPALSGLWNLTQQAQVSLTALQPAVSALRQSLEEPGILGMNGRERERVQGALAALERTAAANALNGLVPRLLLQPMLESVSRAWPVRLNYQGGGEDDIGNEYCIGQEVGSGGCSRVFHGYSLENGVTVAIKLADVAEDSGIPESLVTALLRREYEILASLPEGVGPRVLRFGTMQGKACLVMEYLDGQDLHDSLGTLQHDLRTGQALQRLLGIGFQAVQSVSGIHARGFVHRDIKPENFRIRTVRVFGRELRTFDFGIARRTGEVDESIMGTPEYMPPESFRDGDPADPRRDVFALGATLYWLMTGQTPFHADSNEEVVANIMNPNFRFEVPSTVLLRDHPDLKGKVPYSWLALLDSVIQKALSRDPSQRYRDAGEMLKPLQMLMSHRLPDAVSLPAVGATVPRPMPAASRRPSRSSTRGDSPNAVARASRRGGPSG